MLPIPPIKGTPLILAQREENWTTLNMLYPSAPVIPCEKVLEAPQTRSKNHL